MAKTMRVTCECGWIATVGGFPRQYQADFIAIKVQDHLASDPRHAEPDPNHDD